MFKRHHQIFTALRVLLDVLVVAGAFAIAHALRFGFPDVFPYPEIPPPRETLTVGLLACLLWPLCLRSVGLYRAQRQSTALDEVFGVFKATALGGILLVAVTYFFRQDRYSRGALVLFTILAFAGVGGTRSLFKEALRALRKRGYNLRYVLVLGTGRLAKQVLAQIEAHRELGFRPVGCLSLTRARVGTRIGGAGFAGDGRRPEAAASIDGTEVIGTLRDLPAVLLRQQIDQVLVALPTR